MSNPLPELSTSSSPKFLTSYEKVGRWLILGCAGVAVATGLYRALPYINNFLSMAIEAGYKTTVLMGLLVVIAGVGTIALNPAVHSAMWYFFQGLADKIAATIIRIDPVTRLRSYVSHYLLPTQERIQAIRDKAAGRLKAASERLQTNLSELAKMEERAQYLVSHGSRDSGRNWVDQTKHMQFSALSGKIQTLKSAVERLTKRRDMQQSYVMLLNQLQAVVASYVDVSRFNIDMLIQEYESARETAEGAAEVKGIMGGSIKSQQANMAAQIMTDQMNNWMGEVEGVMAKLQTQIDSSNIDNAIGEQHLLAEMTSRVDKLSSDAENQKLLTSGGEATLLQQAKVQMATAVPTSKFGGLLPR